MLNFCAAFAAIGLQSAPPTAVTPKEGISSPTISGLGTAKRDHLSLLVGASMGCMQG